MVWSLDRSFTAANVQDAVRDFIDNTISGLAGWSTAIPASNSTHRNLQYNLGGNNVHTRTTMEINYNGIYHKAVGPYNSNGSATWQDSVYSGTGGMALGSYTGSGTYQVYLSSLLPDSFLLLNQDKDVVWFWHECDKWFIQGPDGWNSTTGSMSHTTFFGASQNTFAFGGVPFSNNFNVSTYTTCGYDLDTQASANYWDPDISGKVLKGLTLMGNTSTSALGIHGAPLGVISSDDLLLHLGNSGGIAFGSGPLSKVTDGTNWYFRTNSDLNMTALLFPVGTTEPVF